MIKQLVMATNNKNKLREVREILSPLGIEVLSQNEAGAQCVPEENGSTFTENAFIKANAVHEAVNLPTIADDSGLCVDALDGRPGVFSARYAPEGQHCTKLLEEMKGVAEDKRTASFRCSIAYIDRNEKASFDGVLNGQIGHEMRGTNGFGYDPVFMVGCKSLAELTADEKNAISHRGAALMKLYGYLSKKQSEEKAD